MALIPEVVIDAAIDRVVNRLDPNAGINKLYGSQRNMIHEYFKGSDIFYTGIEYRRFYMLKILACVGTFDFLILVTLATFITFEFCHVTFDLLVLSCDF